MRTNFNGVFYDLCAHIYDRERLQFSFFLQKSSQLSHHEKGFWQTKPGHDPPGIGSSTAASPHTLGNMKPQYTPIVKSRAPSSSADELWAEKCQLKNSGSSPESNHVQTLLDGPPAAFEVLLLFFSCNPIQ